MKEALSPQLARRLFQHRLLWLLAASISTVLLVLVLIQMDIAVLIQTASGLSASLLFTAVFLLSAEGLLTSLRIRLFTNNQPPLTEALYANGWYVLLLNILPVRLGEVAAIFIFERLLKQARGAAMMSVVAQRLLDIIVLSSCFVLLAAVATIFSSSVLAIGIAVAIIATATAVIVKLPLLLTGIASLLLQTGWRHGARQRGVLRLVLQARSWQRHQSDAAQLSLGSLLTVLKWLSAFAAIGCLLLATGVPLSAFELLCISVAYCALAIVPLQTLGGIGLGEAGLALMLTAMGVATGQAVACSLITRAVLLLFPLLFLAGIVMLRQLLSRYRST